MPRRQIIDVEIRPRDHTNHRIGEKYAVWVNRTWLGNGPQQSNYLIDERIEWDGHRGLVYVSLGKEQVARVSTLHEAAIEIENHIRRTEPIPLGPVPGCGNVIGVPQTDNGAGDVDKMREIQNALNDILEGKVKPSGNFTEPAPERIPVSAFGVKISRIQ